MKKLLGILLVLALVLSFSLVATTPVAASAVWHVPAQFATIQEAIDSASVNPGDTILVAAGPHAGANVNKAVVIVGAPGGASVITSGVPFRDGHTLTTAFRVFPGTNGAEIRGFRVDCDSSANFFFAVFGRSADDVIVDSLIINGSIQGITNWGGSNWQITGNELNYTEASGGGGIGILVGATLPDFPVASGNMIAGNSIIATATAPDFSTPGILVALDVRWGGYALLDGNEDVSGNQIIGNTIVGNGAANSAGIEVGVIFGTPPPDAGQIAATLGIVTDTTIQGNTITDVYMGLYLYTITNLTVQNNDITDCSHGVLMYDGNENNAINFNNISGNAGFGLYNDTGLAVDATLNWWGDASGPSGQGQGTGDAVSMNVDFMPWLMEEDGTDTTETDTGSGEDASASTTNVSATATGGDTDTTVTVGEYVGNPTGASPGFRSGAVYIDVHVGGTLPTELVVEVACPGTCSGVVLQWWDGSDWPAVVVQEIDGGIVRATLNNVDSSPLISELTGTVFGLGSLSTVGWEGSSVDKVAVVAPWLVLLATMMAGATLLVLRRRRAQT